jgi:hypothetical protein
MSELRHMSDADFADYLERVGADQAESGKEYTAEDYAEAARRIRAGSTPAHEWERITADQAEPGDVIAPVRDAERSMTVTRIASIGESSRYIETESGGRIRPRHTTKYWRLVARSGGTHE